MGNDLSLVWRNPFPRVRCNGLPMVGLEVLQSHSQAANLLESIPFPQATCSISRSCRFVWQSGANSTGSWCWFEGTMRQMARRICRCFPLFSMLPDHAIQKASSGPSSFRMWFCLCTILLNCSSLSLTFLCLLPQFMTHHLCAFRLKSQCRSILSNRREGICSSYLPIIQGMLWTLMIDFLLVFNSIDWFATHSSINLGLLLIHELFLGC